MSPPTREGRPVTGAAGALAEQTVQQEGTAADRRLPLARAEYLTVRPAIPARRMSGAA